MEDAYIEDSVRIRLIEAGLAELLTHGQKDFSLRRVALAAQVSCAAPYRHFKDKDELIRAVIAHIREDFLLLAREIEGVFEPGTPKHITELLTAGVRFWAAGGNFPSFLQVSELSGFDEPILRAIKAFSDRNSLTPEREAELTFSILAAYYGTVTLVTAKHLDIDTAIKRLTKKLLEELK